MDFWGQIVVSGFATGLLYAIVGLTFSLTFAVSRTVNFAQGQAVMLGAVSFFSLTELLHVPTIFSLIIILFLGTILGLMVARLAIVPFSKSNSDSNSAGWLLSTIALGIVVENLVLLIFGSETRGLDFGLPHSPISLLGLQVSRYEVYLLIFGALAALSIEAIVNHSMLGIQFRAVSDSRDHAERLGISARRALYFAYAASTAFAMFAGVLMAPILNVSATMGTMVGVKGFAIAAVAGMVSPSRIFAVGLAFGAIEALATGAWGAGIREIVGFSVLLLAICFYPLGILANAKGRQV